ncbi:hypothetical protein ACGF5M_03130 [Gemmatimonadota bacterium]
MKEEIESLFNAFYSQFVLRDFFGKIGPGFVVLGALALWFVTPKELVVHMQNLGLLFWVTLLPAAWVSGFAVQSFGERGLWWVAQKNNSRKDKGEKDGETEKGKWRVARIPLIYYLPESVELMDWYKFLIRLRHYFQKGKYSIEHRQVERLNVIKEACGNGYVAVLVGFAILSLKVGHNIGRYAWLGGETDWALLYLMPVLLLLFVVMHLLRQMHVHHVIRQYEYTRTFLVERSDELAKDLREEDVKSITDRPFTLPALLFLLAMAFIGFALGAGVWWLQHVSSA